MALQSVHHTWAFGACQVFLTPEYLAIAMEYATDGDMFQLVVRQRGLLEKDARWYFQQLIVAVDYCHRMVRFPHVLCCQIQSCCMRGSNWANASRAYVDYSILGRQARSQSMHSEGSAAVLQHWKALRSRDAESSPHGAGGGKQRHQAGECADRQLAPAADQDLRFWLLQGERVTSDSVHFLCLALSDAAQPSTLKVVYLRV